MKQCLNRIIVEGLMYCWYKNKKEELGRDGENPIYLEVSLDSGLTESEIKTLKDFVEDNEDDETIIELNEFLNELPSENYLNSTPLLVFWEA